MAGVIIILGIYIAALIIISRRYSPPEKLTDAELSDRLIYISRLNEQIGAVQELLTDIELTSGDNIKCITLNWETAAGHDLDVQIWLDGASDCTGAMHALALTRLDELTGQLYDEIGKLPYRHRQNVLRKAKNPIDKRLTAGGGGQNA